MISRSILKCSRLYPNLAICNRPCSWCFYKNIHSSSVILKKRKDEDQSQQVKSVVKIAKHKQIPSVDVWRNMTVKELASAMNKSIQSVLDMMQYVDNSAKYNRPGSVIDNWKVVEDILKKMRLRHRIVSKPEAVVADEEKMSDVHRRDPKDYLDVRLRAPVVTIMGHVDHGKTTLLDKLRNSNVVEGEFGGITQHIGAFSVLIDNQRITFLDTPGHAAFCAMRNRGAQCTDIVILVVAADDGVMEQTVESIKMARDAKVPIIVAVNKIDKPQADVERAKKMLIQHGIQVEDRGGDVQVVPISALKGTNLDTLMESVLVQAELMELKSDYLGPVEGVVIESSTDPYRGKLVTVLVQCGTLRKGDILVAGTAWCKVRGLFNDSGKPFDKAVPSTPVEIIGWRNNLPSAGETVIQVPSEKRASEVMQFREHAESKKKQDEDYLIIKAKTEDYNKKYRAALEEKRKITRYKLRNKGPRQKENIDTHFGPRLSVIIKGDVDGSVEAILDVLDTYSSDLCQLDVVHYGVGPVSPNDISLAQAFSAVIYTFNIGVLNEVKETLKSSGVRISNHNVIYKLVDAIKSDINKLLPEKDVDDVVGEANVLQEFLINEGKSKVPVAGCRCTKGSLKKSALFKLIRNGDVLYSGSVSSLRHLKNEVETIKKDLECGIRLVDQDIRFQPGDVLQCYKIKKVPQRIDWDPGF